MDLLATLFAQVQALCLLGVLVCRGKLPRADQLRRPWWSAVQRSRQSRKEAEEGELAPLGGAGRLAELQLHRCLPSWCS